MSTPTSKSLILLLFTATITIASLAQQKDAKQQEAKQAENLKVLSRKISHDSLISIMREYTYSLGVRCGFCHAQSKTDPKKYDFASDENHHKDVARDMMRMTARLNKKYFEDDLERGKPRITCYTCHHGHEEPEAFVMPKTEGKK